MSALLTYRSRDSFESRFGRKPQTNNKKFTSRFDANYYIHITRKLDTHDVARNRIIDGIDENSPLALPKVLSTLPSHALVISIATDGLFTTSEQRELAAHIPHAKLVMIPSPDGHDGFLLEFEQINTHILGYLKREFPGYYENKDNEAIDEDFAIKKTSVFGEAEVDITRW